MPESYLRHPNYDVDADFAEPADSWIPPEKRNAVEAAIHQGLRDYGFADDPAWSITDAITHQLWGDGDDDA